MSFDLVDGSSELAAFCSDLPSASSYLPNESIDLMHHSKKLSAISSDLTSESKKLPIKS